MKVTAIVPMRHTSERVPGKNYRDFNGKPLFYHITNSLLNSNSIDKVVIDTDSEVITDNIKEFFGDDVLILKRPDHLIDGSIPMNDVLLNIVNQVPSDFYLQTHSTNPLLKSETINAAIEQLSHNLNQENSDPSKLVTEFDNVQTLKSNLIH